MLNDYRTSDQEAICNVQCAEIHIKNSCYKYISRLPKQPCIAKKKCQHEYEIWTRHASLGHIKQSCPTEEEKNTFWLIRTFYKFSLLTRR